MSRHAHPCPDDLLRYADGELRGWPGRKVRAHLKNCWDCRAELQEIEKTIADCVGYRKRVLERLLPPPPAPWNDIYAQFAKMDASTEPDFLESGRERRTWNIRWAAVAAVALLAVGALTYRFRQTPTVEASELLRRAAAAEDAAPRHVRRIRIQTRRRKMMRVLGGAARPASNRADADALNSLGAMFIAASYDWQDPLSARSFEGWRAQVTGRQDEVVEDSSSYRVETTAASGALVSASLTLRKQDLHAVEGRFEFRDHEWVQMTEVTEPDAPAETTAASTGAPSKTITPSLREPGTSPAGTAATATASDELQVIAALHQMGADLGEPIEITRDGGKVLVSGVGIAPQRQQQIDDALRGNPRVQIRFNESQPAAAQPDKETTTESRTEFHDLQERLARQLGGREFFDQLSAEVLDRTEAMMSRVYALRALAERFPPARESELSAADRELLEQLRQEHGAVLRQQAAEIDRMVAPALRSIGVAAALDNAIDAPAQWQPATEGLFESARQIEKLSAVLFGAAPGDSSNDQVPSQLMSRLAQLRARLNVYGTDAASPTRSRK